MLVEKVKTKRYVRKRFLNGKTAQKKSLLLKPDNSVFYRLISFPTFSDSRGNLSFLEGNKNIPFTIKRIYYTYNVPGNTLRGNHAHKELQQVIIPLAGSFEITLDNGIQKETLKLENPATGLYIQPMTWIKIRAYAPNTVCLVLASEEYESDEYIHDYTLFKKVRNRGNFLSKKYQ